MLTVKIEENALHSESDYMTPPFTSELALLFSIPLVVLLWYIFTPLGRQLTVVFPCI